MALQGPYSLMRVSQVREDSYDVDPSTYPQPIITKYDEGYMSPHLPVSPIFSDSRRHKIRPGQVVLGSRTRG